jgi:hypothetical protein
VRLHDWFNLAVLAVLNAENFFYLATGRGFGVFYTSAMVYFLLDTLFVGVFPQSVKSPVVILAHHLCTSLYMLIPYHYPRYHWCMSHCMLVEVNTWLLIARRTIGGKAIELGFYASWILLRNLYYPYLIYAFFNEWRRETALCGSALNPILVTPLMQAFLTGLNYKWTWELVSKLLFPKASARPNSSSRGAVVAGGGGGSKVKISGVEEVAADDGGGGGRDQGAVLRRRRASSSSEGGGGLKARVVPVAQQSPAKAGKAQLQVGGGSASSEGGGGEAFAGHL